MFVTWLFADEDDFFTRLRISPPELFDERKISPERRVELIRLAIKSMDYTEVLDVSELLDAATTYGMVFGRANNQGLAQYFDKALHLVTSHPAMKTEGLNLKLYLSLRIRTIPTFTMASSLCSHTCCNIYAGNTF